MTLTVILKSSGLVIKLIDPLEKWEYFFSHLSFIPQKDGEIRIWPEKTKIFGLFCF